jgi:ribosomal protein S18 acetylase RimI-like enzyme
MDLQNLQAMKEKRRSIRPLLSPSDPGDALTSYYALWHDPRRTQLTVHYDQGQRPDGFIAICQTGADLFRPLVTFRAPDEATATSLLRTALEPNRPYQVIVPVALAAAVRAAMEVSRATLTQIYRLDPSQFQPVINVLVVRVATPDGPPRFQIESQGQVMAMAGTNWRSPVFAEVFVYVHPRARGRGWGKSVVSACTAQLLEERLQPLYMLEESNEASTRIAEGLGYRDTGLRQFVAEGRLSDQAADLQQD